MSTKDLIFKVAVDMFSQKGYSGTSIRHIAGAVGIKESSIYNHFKNKEDILQSILNYQIEGLFHAIKSFDLIKEELDNVLDPLEFWMGGTLAYIKNQPPLSDKIAKIIINEMYLNKKCRDFYLHTLQKERIILTKEILTVMYKKGMIRYIDIDTTSLQYVYMMQGLEIENNIKSMNNEDPEILRQNLFKHITYFINSLKKER